ncbi:hypothetical protein CERZMDRAFT_88400 [Cercospora zeae-maydis SCOH1-5]|uniref:RING-type domain-containing protein n=1 Tax=Cercospora zeae-maydis SCOH1-5 TaxID=717836 RepID=A0A6A6F4T8_9PEZI|nr:hypothetical protein CERZMDRAFT_88400 [Cercospora zeae-maydis SCOH1-5]
MALPTKEDFLADLLPLARQECPICREDMDEPIQLPCRHVYCHDCTHTWLQRNNTCPTCRVELYQQPAEPRIIAHALIDNNNNMMSDAAIDELRRETPGLENMTNDQIRDLMPADRGPIIVSGGFLHMHVSRQIQLMRQVNDFVESLHLPGPALYTIPELPDCFDAMLTDDATRYRFRFKFSWRAETRRYGFDHLSATRDAAFLPATQRLSDEVREFFNAPGQRDLVRQICTAVKAARDDVDDDYQFIFLD